MHSINVVYCIFYSTSWLVSLRGKGWKDLQRQCSPANSSNSSHPAIQEGQSPLSNAALYACASQVRTAGRVLLTPASQPRGTCSWVQRLNHEERAHRLHSEWRLPAARPPLLHMHNYRHLIATFFPFGNMLKTPFSADMFRRISLHPFS